MLSSKPLAREYQQLRVALREAGKTVTEEEALIASCYVIKLLTQLGELDENVADFCVRVGLPVTRNEALALAGDFS